MYITINKDNRSNVVECFIHTSKGGICQANIAAVNHMISLAMRSGVKISEIVDQLKGINCPACIKIKTKVEDIYGLSCSDIIAKVLEDFTNNNQSVTNILNSRICPQCEQDLQFEEGCVICPNCG